VRPLYKTTIVVWTEDNTDGISAERLGRELSIGDAYCSVKNCELVKDPDNDDNWDDTDFFGQEEETDEEEEEE
jgi:hypothetical protein